MSTPLDPNEEHLLSLKCVFGVNGGVKKGQALAVLLFGRVMVSETGCWEYQGARDRKGYGLLRAGREKEQRAHRLAMAVVQGSLPPDVFVCHHCDNPSCIRPSHLFLGTASDNSADRQRKGRTKNLHLSAEYWRSRTHCFRGHPYDKDNMRIRYDGKRQCRTCAREKQRRFRCSQKQREHYAEST